MNGISCRGHTTQNLGGRHPQWSPSSPVDPVIGKRFLQNHRHNLELFELGNFILVVNAQEMGTVVLGGLGGLACCSTTGQVILFGEYERFHIPLQS